MRQILYHFFTKDRIILIIITLVAIAILLGIQFLFWPRVDLSELSSPVNPEFECDFFQDSYIGSDENCYFASLIKIRFKEQVAPEELERIIGTVGGEVESDVRLFYEVDNIRIRIPAQTEEEQRSIIEELYNQNLNIESIEPVLIGRPPFILF